MQKATIERPQWSWGDALLIILFFVFIYGVSIPLQFGIASMTGELAEFNNSANPSIPESALVISHVGKAIGLMGGIMLVCRRKNYTWRDLGFRQSTRTWLIISVAIALIMFPIRLIMAHLLVGIMPEWEVGAGGVFLDNSYSWAYNLLLVLIVTFIVPVTEEVFYRGFLYTWFRNRRPFWIAVFFSSMMFGVSHIIPIQIVMSIVLSVIITLVFEKSGSLWNAITIHATNNALGATLALLLPFIADSLR